MRISYSAKNTFKDCSEKYRLHYIERLRSQYMESPLFFGSALDEAFSRLLLEKKKELTDIELAMMQSSAYEIFDDMMYKIDHNGVKVNIATYPLCRYNKSDIDCSIFKTEDKTLITKFDSEITNVVEFIDNIHSKLKDRSKIHEDDWKAYNYIAWLSLKRKGYLMIDAYSRQIMPHIHEVFDIQKEITIPNSSGDEVYGKIDFIASFTSNPDQKYICDNKTSSRAYKADSVGISDQLATYCEALGMSHAAYVVIDKSVYKKVPFIHTQIIKDTILPATTEKSLDEYESVIYSILDNKFEKNFDSKCFFYGKKCAFYSFCRDGSTNGLIKMGDKNVTGINVEKGSCQISGRSKDGTNEVL